MEKITWKWVGGNNGHYEVYVDGQFVESCDEGEINGVVRRLEEWYKVNDQLKSQLVNWCSKVIYAKEGGGMVNTYRMLKDIDKIIADAFDHEPVIPD